jgi:hypothetical protein
MSAKVTPEPQHTAENETKPPVLAWEASKDKPEKDEPPRAPIPDPKQGMFGFKDTCSIKDQVRQCMEKQKPYSVFEYYKEDSKWSEIAMHPVFENTTLGVIALNAVYIAIDTDWNKAEPLTPTNTYSLTESHGFFQFMEHSFCLYFTMEWIVRFMSFKRKANGLKDGWFVFDSALVFMMVMETWVLLIVMTAIGGGGGSPIGGTSILRLFRLLRLSRLMRMLRSLPELMILIKGMVTAMKSVAYVMGLLLLITYVFAIAFTQLAVQDEVKECDMGNTYFANVSHAMYSLLTYATFLDDLSQFTDCLRHEAWYLLILTFMFIALSSLTVMNMLIGVLCEVVSAVAERERDDLRTENLTANMQKIIDELDDNRNNQISYKEFTNIIQKPEAITALHDVGVDPVSIVDFAELFFFEDGQGIELTFESFMEVVLDLRESNSATVKDMLNLWMKIKMSVNKDITGTKQALDALKDRAEYKMIGIDEKHEKMEGQIGKIMKDLQRLCSKA